MWDGLWKVAMPGVAAVSQRGEPEISVIAPMHNEAENVRPLFEEIRAALEPLGRSFEVLLVNDGSSDATGELLDEVAASDPRLRPVHLERSFGQAAALCAGFEMARGERVLTLDGDLQNDPADLPRVLRLLEEGGYRAVSGWRRRRKEGYARRVLPSKIANWLIAALTGVPSRDNGCGLKAYRAEVVKGKYLPHGMHRFMPAVFGVRGAEFAQIEVNDRPRRAGKSHYGLSRVFPVVRDLLTIPYLLRSSSSTLARLGMLLLAGGAGGAGGVFGLVLLSHGTWLLGGVVIGLGAVLTGYAGCVSRNLDRWRRAQVEKTFRIARVGPGIGRPSRSAPNRSSHSPQSTEGRMRV